MDHKIVVISNGISKEDCELGIQMINEFNSNNELLDFKDNKNVKVAPYKQAHKLDKHDENREKKLLLNKKELVKIDRMLGDKGTTIVPLAIFVNNNRIKVKIGVCKGKKLWNKKEDIKSRDIDRDAKRELNYK